MSGFFKGVENKEIYIIGAVLFLLLLSNNFSFTGLSVNQDRHYRLRNSHCVNCFERAYVRQDASMAMSPNVGYLRASESRSQNPSRHQSGIGEICYLNNGGRGRLTLGEGNSLDCLPLR